MHDSLRGHRGFTLIEVLVATAILSVGIVTVLCAFQTSLSALGSVREGLWAGMLIGEKAADLEGAAQEGDESALRSARGRFGGVYEDFEWETSVVDLSLPDSAGDDRSCALKRVNVWVWRDDERRYGRTIYVWLNRRGTRK